MELTPSARRRAFLEYCVLSPRSVVILLVWGLVFGVSADFDYRLFNLDYETMADIGLTCTHITLVNSALILFLYFTRSKS